MNTKDHKVVLVDLDSTLAKKDWNSDHYDPSHIGPPVPLMLARVKQWLAEGAEVIIFTARMDPAHTEEELEASRKAIAAWTRKWVG